MKNNDNCKKCGGKNIIYGSDFEHGYTINATTECADCGYKGKYKDGLFDRLKSIKVNVFFSIAVIFWIELGLIYTLIKVI